MTDSTLNRFIASGTNAERLAFTPSPPTPGSGPDQSYIWHETDTGDTFMWDFDASAWDQVNGATGLANDLTFDTSGGATAPAVFDGSVAKTIDYSTVGAAASDHTHTLDGLSDVDTTGVADGDALVYDSGTSTWGPGAASSGTSYEAGPITAPLSTDFSWLNQGTSTVTDGVDALILKPQPNALARSLIKAVPTAPFDIYCRATVDGLSTAGVTTTISTTAGIVLRNSANGNVVTFGIGCDRNTSGALTPYLGLQRWTSSGATFSSSVSVKYGIGHWKWVRLNVTSTTITAYASMDGKNWHQQSTDTISSFISAVTDYGVFATASANITECIMAFPYFSTTAPS